MTFGDNLNPKCCERDSEDDANIGVGKYDGCVMLLRKGDWEPHIQARGRHVTPAGCHTPLALASMWLPELCSPLAAGHLCV